MSEAPSNTDAAKIADELATLGEAPPSAAELAFDDADHELAPLDPIDPEVASVARLAELAQPLAFDDLSELELHRGWRAVEQRLPGAAAAPQPRRGASAKPLLFAAVGLAAAAAVLFLVVQPGDGREQAKAPTQDLQPQQVMELGEQARAALRIVDDGQTDTERATQLATAYQRELAAQQEQGG